MLHTFFSGFGRMSCNVLNWAEGRLLFKMVVKSLSYLNLELRQHIEHDSVCFIREQRSYVLYNLYISKTKITLEKA